MYYLHTPEPRQFRWGAPGNCGWSRTYQCSSRTIWNTKFLGNFSQPPSNLNDIGQPSNWKGGTSTPPPKVEIVPGCSPDNWSASAAFHAQIKLSWECVSGPGVCCGISRTIEVSGHSKWLFDYQKRDLDVGISGNARSDRKLLGM